MNHKKRLLAMILAAAFVTTTGNSTAQTLDALPEILPAAPIETAADGFFLQPDDSGVEIELAGAAGDPGLCLLAWGSPLFETGFRQVEPASWAIIVSGSERNAALMPVRKTGASVYGAPAWKPRCRKSLEVRF